MGLPQLSTQALSPNLFAAYLALSSLASCIGKEKSKFVGKRMALGKVLLGGSSGVLILSLFAAHMLFTLIPSTVAFFLYVVSIATSVFTAVRHRSQALMIITLLAGYLVPFLVDSAKPNIWVFAGYEGLFSMVMIVLSLRYSFRGAYFTAFGVFHLPLLISTLFGDDTGSRPAILTVVILQHLLLLGYLFSVPKTA